MSRTRSQRIVKMSGLYAPFLVIAVLGASTIPAVASGCASSRDFDASRAHWATVRSHPVNASDHEASCRIYASYFYELVTLRLDTASCVGDADHLRKLAVLDSEIDAFNNLLATKCGS